MSQQQNTQIDHARREKAQDKLRSLFRVLEDFKVLTPTEPRTIESVTTTALTHLYKESIVSSTLGQLNDKGGDNADAIAEQNFLRVTYEDCAKSDIKYLKKEPGYKDPTMDDSDSLSMLLKHFIDAGEPISPLGSSKVVTQEKMDFHMKRATKRFIELSAGL